MGESGYGQVGPRLPELGQLAAALLGSAQHRHAIQHLVRHRSGGPLPLSGAPGVPHRLGFAGETGAAEAIEVIGAHAADIVRHVVPQQLFPVGQVFGAAGGVTHDVGGNGHIGDVPADLGRAEADRFLQVGQTSPVRPDGQPAVGQLAG